MKMHSSQLILYRRARKSIVTIPDIEKKFGADIANFSQRDFSDGKVV